jgi:hypothetical protein
MNGVTAPFRVPDWHVQNPGFELKVWLVGESGDLAI